MTVVNDRAFCSCFDTAMFCRLKTQRLSCRQNQHVRLDHGISHVAGYRKIVVKERMRACRLRGLMISITNIDDGMARQHIENPNIVFVAKPAAKGVYSAMGADQSAGNLTEPPTAPLEISIFFSALRRASPLGSSKLPEPGSVFSLSSGLLFSSSNSKALFCT